MIWILIDLREVDKMNPILQAGIIGGIAGGAGVIIFALLQKPRYCPKCNTRLPKFRLPKNAQQSALGGWTCPKCSCEIDRNGKLRD